MSAASNVIALASEEAVDRAWRAYAEHVTRLRGDPTLLSDRAFNEESVRRHERWKRLFLIQEAGE